MVAVCVCVCVCHQHTVWRDGRAVNECVVHLTAPTFRVRGYRGSGVGLGEGARVER